MEVALKALSTLALGLGLATGVFAQQDGKVVFPKDLQWKTMDTVAFDSNSPGYENSTPEQRRLATAIWGQAIKNFPLDKGRRSKKSPAFVNLAVFDFGEKKIIFTSLRAASAAYALCEDPLNGGQNAPIYSMCPLRLIIQDKATGESEQQDFASYCNMTTNSKYRPKTRNYEQVAIDSNIKMAYIRAVQYDKPAPECNRVIRLP
jgi:hypothetical protein